MWKKVTRMKFLRAEIYGFGKWIDKTFDFSGRLLTCLYGENEAGKSTLQSFILYMLFGLPPRKRNLYQPKNSNKMGGTLTIVDDPIGIFTIERTDDHVRCLLPNGKIEGEDWLFEQLNGLTQEVYTSIYAFSVNDLIEIRRMKQEQLSDVLFSIGLTGATAIYQVEKKLEKKLASLYKRTGRIPEINKQIKVVQEKHNDLLRFKQNETTYRDKKELKEKLEAHIQKRRLDVQTAQAEVDENEKILHLVPFLHEYQTTIEKLNLYDKNIPFPENGIERYQTLKKQIIPLQSEYNTLKQNEEEFKNKLNHLMNELYPASIYEAARTILNERLTDDNLKQQINEKEKKIEQINGVLKEQLQPLDMDEDEIKEIVLPFHIESTWKEICETNIQLQQEGEQLTEEYNLITETVEQINLEKQAVHSQLLSTEKVSEMQTKINEYELTVTAAKNNREQKNKMKQWEKKQERLANLTLVGTVLFASLSVFFALRIDNYLLFGITAMIVILGLTQFTFIKKSMDETGNNNTSNEFKNMITESEKNKLENLLHKNQDLQTNVRMLENEVKRVELQKIEWQEKKRMFDHKESKWLDRLKTEQFQYPFLRKVDPSHWIELLQKLQQVKQLIREKHDMQNEIDDLQEKRFHLQRKLAEFASDIGWTNSTITMEEIGQIVEKYMINNQSITHYNELLEKNEVNQVELKAKITSFEKEINALMEVAGVETEEEYFRTARELEDKEKLLNRKTELEQQIRPVFSEEVTNEILTKEISQYELERKINNLKELINDCQHEVSDLNKQLATVELEIRQMETSDSNSEAAFSYQIELEKLNALAKEWAITQVAQTTLMKAKAAYQEKYLSEVIELTSKYFNKLTNGKYIHVHAPTASKLFQVEASNYIRYTVDELSQGTIDQLYVSLRLAISRVMSEKFVVPLIIDDAFVNFDNKRTEEILNIVQEFASTQQILLFTCKSDIAQTLQAQHISTEVNV